MAMVRATLSILAIINLGEKKQKFATFLSIFLFFLIPGKKWNINLKNINYASY